MRIYQDFREVRSEVRRDLAEMGIGVHTQTYQDKYIGDDPQMATKELQNYMYCVYDTSKPSEMQPTQPWADAEFQERISGKHMNPGEAYRLRKDVWDDFLDDEGKFGYTYPDRISDFNQIDCVVSTLENDMYIIDQHAAHEKVMYERLLRESKNSKITAQMINPPIIVTLTDVEQDVLNKHLDEFKNAGFDIEEFGGKEYKINSIPNIFPSIPKAELFNEMLSDSTNYDIISPSELILAKTASMACKAAIKGNMRISLMEANDLFDELLSLDNPYNCPHGRPTIIKMSKQEIEKKFKRIV